MVQNQWKFFFKSLKNSNWNKNLWNWNLDCKSWGKKAVRGGDRKDLFFFKISAFFSVCFFSTGRLPAIAWSTKWVLRTFGCTALKMRWRKRRERRGILTWGWPSSWPGLSLFVWCVFGKQPHSSWFTDRQTDRQKCFDSPVLSGGWGGDFTLKEQVDANVISRTRYVSLKLSASKSKIQLNCHISSYVCVNQWSSLRAVSSWIYWNEHS